MGMAVGVDYCLFYLRRDREERARGRAPEAALRIAAATSGRSVLISGLTVIVAMAGMFLSGMQLFDGFAVATILVVLIAMAGSVTVLPALMSLLGDKVEFGRIPFLGRVRQQAGGGRAWKIVLDRVLARPGISAALAAGALLALASPVIGIHTRRAERAAAAPGQHPARAELRAHHGGVSRRPGPGAGRRQGARHPVSGRPAGHRRPGRLAQPRDRPAETR